jgi:hypothetical protein
LAKNTIVANLDKIIDFGTPPDSGFLKGRPVNGGAGADINIVLKNDDTKLIHFFVFAFFQTITEAIGSNHRMSMKHNAVTHFHTGIKHRARMNQNIIPDLAPRAYYRMGMNGCPGSNNHIGPNHRERMNGAVSPQFCGGVDRGLFADPRYPNRFQTAQFPNDLDKGAKGVNYGYGGKAGVGQADIKPDWNDQGTRSGPFDTFQIFGVFKKADFGWSRMGKGPGPNNYARSIPLHRSRNPGGNFIESGLHPGILGKIWHPAMACMDSPTLPFGRFADKSKYGKSFGVLARFWVAEFPTPIQA